MTLTISTSIAGLQPAVLEDEGIRDDDDEVDRETLFTSMADVTGSRAVGTEYVATPGPRMVMVGLKTDADRALTLEAKPPAGAFAVYQARANRTDSGPALKVGTLTFLVPPGWTYKVVNVVGDASAFDFWTEADL